MKRLVLIGLATLTGLVLLEMFVFGPVNECYGGESDTKGEGFKIVELIDCSGDKFSPDDGDSFYCVINDKKVFVRVLGIDTPETMHEEHGICENQKLGPEATKFANNILMNAKNITLVHKVGDVGSYGRPLVHVLVDGKLFAPMLVKAGLAYSTLEHYGDNGFSGYAAEINHVWANMTPPEFENPHKFRKKMREKCPQPE
ncbi:thermonuclease family protein [Candidatus Kuenenbacteria bacterium]|nr:thermonuclease family protein [Candidatus Kuenenbacteria bacterium]